MKRTPEALDLLGSDAGFSTMKYYEPWLYSRDESNTVETRQDIG
jgi:hypothetical protein